MNRINQKHVLNYKRKNCIKVVRVILQILILTALAVLFYKAVFSVNKYKEPDRSLWNKRDGFVALSFPEISLSEHPKKMTKPQLDKYLGFLHGWGYTTISQKDILDYYLNNKPLPHKSLFLTFDIGVKDSIQFIQPLLNKYNYKATLLTYANRFENNDQYFIQQEDCSDMKKTGFWEFGTNGYRLAYINIFDMQSRFFPLLHQNDFMGREKTESYNHYLMDFIRNKDMIPVETKKEMTERINLDYKKMQEVYTKYVGFVPELYILMNSNSPYYGSNKLVGEVNIANIQRMFKLNFNREGCCYNTPTENIYDLTRLQIQPYWHINHLVMNLKMDTNHSIQFVTGDKEFAGKWDIVNGAAEFDRNRIVVTSSYKGEGSIFLKGSEATMDLELGTTIPTSIMGKQSIYLRHDTKIGSYIRVTLKDNNITVEQKVPGGTGTKTVFEHVLDTHGNTVRKLELVLKDSILTVIVDKKVLSNSIELDSSIARGGISLSSQYDSETKNDKIYDAVFDDFFILKPAFVQSTKQEVLYDNRYSGFNKVRNTIKQFFINLVDWFVENL